MKRADYLEMRRSILADCDEKLEALDKVFAMFGGAPLAKPGTSNGVAAATWDHAMSKRDAVREAVKRLSVSQFSLKDVRFALEQNLPALSAQIADNSLSANLSKLAERGELKVARSKIGKAPAIYERVPVAIVPEDDKMIRDIASIDCAYRQPGP